MASDASESAPDFPSLADIREDEGLQGICKTMSNVQK